MKKEKEVAEFLLFIVAIPFLLYVSYLLFARSVIKRLVLCLDIDRLEFLKTLQNEDSRDLEDLLTREIREKIKLLALRGKWLTAKSSLGGFLSSDDAKRMTGEFVLIFENADNERAGVPFLFARLRAKGAGRELEEFGREWNRFYVLLRLLPWTPLGFSFRRL